MSDFIDIFNLDGETFVTKTQAQEGKESEFYKPYPEDGKDGVYKSLIRFLPNVADPKKSKIHKYYVYMKDSEGQGFSVDCPSTIGKKSILKDIFWKLKGSHSAADQELAKQFSRKEDYYALVQIVQDKNKPELEGKIMIFKFGKKLNDMIEAQIKPEYGDSSNPFDLFNGKLFAVQVRKVGEWNNYDLCSFVGERTPIKINGVAMQKNQNDMKSILDYLNEGPKNLTSFDYKDWDDELTEKVHSVIRNTVPEARVVNEIISGANSAPTRTAPVQTSQPNSTSSEATNDFFAEANQTKVGSNKNEGAQSSVPQTASNSSMSSLEDLYNDL